MTPKWLSRLSDEELVRGFIDDPDLTEIERNLLDRLEKANEKLEKFENGEF